MINIPNRVTLQQAQDMRAAAEKGSEPGLYLAAASAFRELKMKAAAEAMEKRARHYKTIPLVSVPPFNEASGTIRILTLVTILLLACMTTVEPLATYPAFQRSERDERDYPADTSPEVPTKTAMPARRDIHQTQEPTMPQSQSITLSHCATVTADTALHLRAEPGADKQVIAWLTNGQTVKVTSRENPNWWKISDGFFIGYAKAEYLKESECE